MQIASVESQVSTQQSQLQKLNTLAVSYQVKVEGDNQTAVVEKTSDGYRAHIAGLRSIAANGVNELAAEVNLAAKIIDLQA